MSPGDIYQGAKRRLLAEPHIVHSILVSVVVAAATLYAVVSKDHSGNVWVVYGAAVGSGVGRNGSGSPQRKEDMT